MAETAFSWVQDQLLLAKQESGRSFSEIADGIAISGGPILTEVRLRKIFMEYRQPPRSEVLEPLTRELGMDWQEVRRRAYGRD